MLIPQTIYINLAESQILSILKLNHTIKVQFFLILFLKKFSISEFIYVQKRKFQAQGIYNRFMFKSYLTGSQNIGQTFRPYTIQEAPTPKSLIAANRVTKHRHYTEKFVQENPRKLNNTNFSSINIQESLTKSKKKNYTSQFEKRKLGIYETCKESTNHGNRKDLFANTFSKNIFTILRVVKDMCSELRLLCEDIKYFFSVQSTILKGKVDRTIKQVSEMDFDTLQQKIMRYQQEDEKMMTFPDQSKFSLSRKKTAETFTNERQTLSKPKKLSNKIWQSNFFMKLSMNTSQQLASYSLDEPSQRVCFNNPNKQNLSKMEQQLDSIAEIISKMQRLAT